MTQAPPPWRLAAYDSPSLEQADAISRFLQEQLPGARHPEKDRFARWKLVDNPVRPGFATAMVVDPGERIVSLCSVTPKRMLRHGRELPCGEIGDTFTDAPYLRKGMFAACVDGSRARAEAAGLGIIYGLPNDQSLPGYVRKLNFAAKDDLRIDAHYALLGTQPLAARTRLAQSPPLRAVVGHPLLSRASRGAARLLFEATRPRSTAAVALETTFGADHDDLWRRASPALPTAIVRDARYLRWRFAQNPFDYKVLSVRLGGLLIGYLAALTIHHGDEGPFAHTLLVDWLYDPEHAHVAGRALLSAAVAHAFKQRSDVISAVVSRSSPMPLPFGRLGFVRRDRHMPLIIHRSEQGLDLLADRAPWHFTLSDTDAF